jgi:hypothetical protein
MDLKYLGMSATDQRCMHEEVRSRLSSRNISDSVWVLPHSIRKLDKKNRTHFVCFVWARNFTSHIKEQKLRIFDNVDLRDEVTGGWKKLLFRNLYPLPNIIWWSNRGTWNDCEHARERESGMVATFWSANLKERPLARPRSKWQYKMDLIG